ncbi:hypothetical protein GCM10010985_59140 [Caballeronia grimmiae]|uniref:Uncharacterized protein n=1 Tax=Caballeronia grimmiae TaxID=1071679 RepID=A0ABQ1S778_9BURK|nr:hypothetical protein GCM10010985_59140 [Caballeronia grimmiae]
MMPVTPVTGKAWGIQAKHRTDIVCAQQCDQAIEARPRNRAACRAP